MDIKFYLDDFNLIVFDKKIDAEIKLLKNDTEIDFTLNDYSLSFKDEYEDRDIFYVLVNKVKYDVEPRYISFTKKFDDEYCPDVNTLGSFYSKTSTTFRTWSPFSNGAELIIEDISFTMNYLGKGLYEKTLTGNFSSAKYHYVINRNGKNFRLMDIFSYSLAKDNLNSYVIDLDKISKEKVVPKDKDNTIIYELSVRDFSSDQNAPFKYKKKFKAFSEEGLKLNDKEIGIDYLKNLGVSHIQLMPILNYSNDDADYNWGYNPINYNTFKLDYVCGDYSSAPIEEFKELVNKLHSCDLKVTLDVIYNHVYRVKESPFNTILPYYFFRYDKDNKLGNASWCGNETRSEAKFLREYLNLINKRLITLYDIDGLRFDISGILDTDTINYFISEAKKIKPDFMLVGEGWHMGDILADDKKASYINSDKMPGFILFNGSYKKLLIGENNEIDSSAYLYGDKTKEEEVIKGLEANLEHFNELNSLNYVECHDNYTFADRLSLLHFDDLTRKDISKGALAMIIFSKGIPFIHAGQEFLRSKKFKNNSYNLGDDVNLIDWNLMCENYDVVNYFKELIKIKNTYFKEKLNHNTYISHYYDLLIYSIDDVDIFINNSEYPYVYTNWITYTDIYYPSGEYLHNLTTFDIPSYSLVLAKKL